MFQARLPLGARLIRAVTDGRGRDAHTLSGGLVFMHGLNHRPLGLGLLGIDCILCLLRLFLSDGGRLRNNGRRVTAAMKGEGSGGMAFSVPGGSWRGSTSSRFDI